MHILLIEDMAGFAQPITALLTSKGHTVTAIAGVHSVGRATLTGILASAQAGPMDDSWDGDSSRLIEVDLKDVDLAFSDGDFLGPVKNGWDVVPALVANGIVCVAISGAGANNPLMVKAGARVSLPKEFVACALRDSILCPADCLETPEAVNARLAPWVDGMRKRVLNRHRTGETVDLGYPFLAELEKGNA